MTARQAIPRTHYSRPAAGRLPVLTLILCPWFAAAGEIEDGYSAYQEGDFSTAFRLLNSAATDDRPQLQNLVALMHYLGQGTRGDPVAAHDLFHKAAMNGSIEARKNLGVLHTLGAPGVDVNFEEARIWFATVQATGHEEPPGSKRSSTAIPGTIKTVITYDTDDNSNGKFTYLTFCAGCHGFSGMHFFEYAPSFAMGQRLTKSDAELMQSILHGKGLMPSWEDKLPLSDLEDALAYLRLLSVQTAYGTDTSGINAEPEMYFIFYPRGAGKADAINPHISADDDF